MKKYAGYTLIELSISLTLIALLLAGGLAVFSRVSEAKKYRTTNERMDAIEEAIGRFIDLNGYIPCPGYGTDPESLSSFGVATVYASAVSGSQIDVSATDNSFTTPSLPNGFLGVGVGTVITTAGFTSAANKGTFTVISRPASNKIIVTGASSLVTESTAAGVANVHSCNGADDGSGMVPVRTLGLPDYYAYDGWDRKFNVRVASGMGNVTDYASNEFMGDLSVTDLNGNEKTDINRPSPDNRGAAYVLWSSGPNGLGAWTKNSASSLTMPTAGSPEWENSNHEINKRHIQDDRTYNFDDILRFKMKRIGAKAKKITALPFRIPSYICTNASILVKGGDPASSASTLLGGFYAVYPTNASQVYQTASSLKVLCENQLPVCYPTPVDISQPAIALWLDASDPAAGGSVVNNSTLSVWRDKSGYNRDGAAIGTPTYLASGLNGKPVIQFDGSDAYNIGSYSGYHNGSQVTIFAVIKPTTITGRQTIFSARSNSATTNSFHLEYGTGNGGTGRVAISSSAGFAAETANNVIAAGGTYLISYRRDGGGTHTLNINGVSQTLTVTAATYNTNTEDKMIGEGAGATNRMNGNLAELIIFNTNLPDALRSSTETYLIKKWFQGSCY